ncbi:hypothetical protein ACFY2W_34070 [Streptomyces sp. NPDC001262]
MHQFNCGFWPAFGTPVLLLLTDFTAKAGWADAWNGSPATC